MLGEEFWSLRWEKNWRENSNLDLECVSLNGEILNLWNQDQLDFKISSIHSYKLCRGQLKQRKDLKRVNSKAALQEVLKSILSILNFIMLNL